MAGLSARFDLTWDDAELYRRFGPKFDKRLAFGVVGALNRTARRVQEAEFQNFEAKFTVRKREYFEGTSTRPGGAAARLYKASISKGRAYAEVAAVASSQAAERRTILNLFEQGGVRKPFTQGARDVAVPTIGGPARPTFRDSVQRDYTFAGLKFRGYRRGRLLKKRRRGRGDVPETVFGEFGRLMRSQLALGNVQWKGEHRTFIVMHSDNAPYGEVLQRYGKKRDEVRQVYEFKPPFNLDDRLHWLDIAREIAERWLHEDIEADVIRGIAIGAGQA